MKAPRSFPILLGALAVAACGNNTPLMSNIVTASGAAGTTGGGTGSAGATATGQAGAIVTGEAGMLGQAGTTGQAGAVGQAGTPGQGAAGGDSAPGITMCGDPTLPSGACAAGAYHRVGGPCQCQDGMTCVCGNTCTDPKTDDDNCGVCGIRCGPTSTCNNGVCGPAPVEVLAARPGCGSIDLAASGDTLYWTDAGHALVQSRPFAGGATTTIANGEKPSHVVVAGTSVFWLYTNATIRRSVGGALPSTVFTAPTTIGGFVVSPDGASVYFSSGTTVSRVPASGGAPVVVAREENGGIPGGLALTGNTIAFPTSINGDVDAVTLIDGQVASCGLPDPMGNFIGVNCKRLARSQGELFVDTILFPPGAVIWADGTNLKSESPTGSGVFDALAMTNSNPISGLAFTNGISYYAEASADDGTGGVIYKAINRNLLPVRLARGQKTPRSLVTGPTKVYWSTSDCTIESTGL